MRNIVAKSKKIKTNHSFSIFLFVSSIFLSIGYFSIAFLYYIKYGKDLF